MSDLVQFTTSDGLKLTGLLSGDNHPITVIHIHGKCGNFHDNKFLKQMFSDYPNKGVNLLAFNNRGSSVFSEGVKGGEVVYLGTAVERIEDCIYDLQAAIDFVSSFSERIILQGHSFGCEKIFYYALQNRDSPVELIFLSPSDGYRLQEVFIYPEKVESQLRRLHDTYRLNGMEWLPDQEYGIRNKRANYHVPITARALVDLIEGPAFELFRVSEPWTERPLENPTFCFLGSEDSLQVDPVARMEGAMKDRFSRISIAITPGSEHDLRPNMDVTIRQILDWILSGSGRSCL